MKKRLLIASILIEALCLLVPAFFCEGFVNYVVNVATLLSGLCGLGTLCIAILLYDRYGVESKTKEQEIRSIEEAIKEMQKVHFSLCFLSDQTNSEIPSDYIISLSFQSKKEDVLECLTPEALSTFLYYKDSGIYGCVQLVENIQSKVFLPKSIAEAVQQLSVFKYERQMISKDFRPITTLSAFSDRINNMNDTLNGADTKLPEQQFRVIQFIDVYFRIKEAIIEWYKANSINIEQLNL